MLSPKDFERAALQARTLVEFRTGGPVVPQETPDEPWATSHLAFLVQRALRLYRAGDVLGAGIDLGFVQGVLVSKDGINPLELQASY